MNMPLGEMGNVPESLKKITPDDILGTIVVLTFFGIFITVIGVGAFTIVSWIHSSLR